jgi:hypothetical protein
VLHCCLRVGGQCQLCVMQVLDLRKFKEALEVVPFDSDVTCLAWDHTGKYLVCFFSIQFHAHVNHCREQRSSCVTTLCKSW